MPHSQKLSDFVQDITWGLTYLTGYFLHSMGNYHNLMNVTFSELIMLSYSCENKL